LAIAVDDCQTEALVQNHRRARQGRRATRTGMAWRFRSGPMQNLLVRPKH
jgi:hypothetical protein